MSKKHFIAIAATIREQYQGESDPQRLDAIRATVRRLCAVFGDENPRFDSHRFTVACGIN